MKDEKSKENSSAKTEVTEAEKSKPVGVVELFKYTSPKERLLILLGVTAGLLSGVCIPTTTIVFGDIVNTFVFNAQNVSILADRLNTTEERIVENAGGQNLEDDLRFFVIFLAVLALILWALNYLFISTFNYVAECQVFRLRTKYLNCILTKEISWFDVHETREFTSRFTQDLNQVQEGTGEKIGIYLFFTSNSVLSLVIAFYYGWLLTLVTLVVCPLLGVTMAVMAKVTSSLTTSEMDGYAKSGGIAEEAISLIRTVVAFEGHEKEMDRYGKSLITAKKAGLKRGFIAGISFGLSGLIIYCGFSIAFWYGTKLILSSSYPSDIDDYNPKDLVIVLFSILFSALNIGQAAPYFQAFTIARGAAAGIFKVLQEPSHQDTENGMTLNEIKGKIEFENLQFSYPSRSDVNVLKGVNLEIHPGQTLAIVGASGSGKSTCLQLLMRFYEPQNGVITLDGHNIRSLKMNWLRDNIGIVSQEPVLFAMTIAENIRLGRESATFDDIQDAAKQANAHNFIINFPKGYNTLLGDNGAQVSGGQKQRIAIARVILKNPKILLLDEATSSIDSSNEAVIQETLEEFKKNRTTIIVSHRLSAIQSADKIVVMKDGVIVQQGTHQDFEGLYDINAAVRQSTPGKDTKAKEDIINDIRYEKSLSQEDTKIDIGDNTDLLKESLTERIFNRSKRKNKSNQVTYSMIDLMAYNKPEWFYILVGSLSASVTGLMYPAYAIVFGEVLENLSIDDPEVVQRNANIHAIQFLAIGIIGATAECIQNCALTLSGELLTERLRKKVFKSILYQEIGWFDKEENSVGAICSRLSLDASNVQGATGVRIGLLVQSATTIVSSLLLAIYINYKLGLMLAPTVPLLSIVIYYQTKIAAGQSVTEAESLRIAGQIASEAIVNIKTVAGYRKECYFTQKYKDSILGAHLQSLRKMHIRGVLFGAAQALPTLQYAVLMFYGGYLILNEGVKYGDVFKVGEALIFGAIMVGQSLAFAPSVSKAKISAQRIMEILKRTPDIDSNPASGLRLFKGIENISMNDVQFTYPNRSSIRVLDDLTMNIDKGQTIALVGASGCGKSTIIGILLRYYRTSGGSVKINGLDIENLNINSIRRLFGIVSQEPVLFNRSLAENILYGDHSGEATMEDVILASKEANIHSFIQSLPDGYDTMAGDKGAQLSGGQKQRIAIARALLRNPEVLLLDEATSALDSENEKIVQRTLESAQNGRTNIVVTHRLPSIQNADKIFVIKDAKVVESGTHRELLQREGEYYYLYGNASGT